MNGRAWSRRFAPSLVLAAATAGALGCQGTPADSAANGDFVAFGSDFEGFDTWTSSTVENTTPGGSTHVSGKRIVYINHMPPADATAFPVGTVIVKRTVVDGKLFGRTKRGGTFNPKGAIGWEWFELNETPTGVAIAWRGVGPPKGTVYGGDPNAGCNTCHRLVPDNDYVFSLGLTLGGKTDASAPGGPEAGVDGGVDAEADAGTDLETDAGTDDASHE